MLIEGNIVRAVEISKKKPKSWIFRLEKEGEYSTHLGRIDHDNIIGLEYGKVISLIKGEVIILKPSPRDFLRSFTLKTQIMYADDCAIACSVAGIGNGMNVGEAGTGSGALTTFLAWTVAPDGHVYTFDINEKHLRNAERNIQMTGLQNRVTFQVIDIREPFNVPPLDAFFLDFSTPFEAIDTITPNLLGGGHLICFVPNWGQVEQIVDKINQNSELALQRVFELTRRDFNINPEKHIMRPNFRSIVYSGILIHSIKIIS
ncbi:MAG: tRNA (adenine-N1)-methyltransferase [Candidatus Hodarchaeales archaeon]